MSQPEHAEPETAEPHTAEPHTADRASPRVVETARAKVNLTLRVLGRRPDGYHQLDSLVAFARFGDRLTIESGRTGRTQAAASVPDLTVEGPFAGAIEGRNLVRSALELVREQLPDLDFEQAVLDKQIPVAAGLGGGSADAAAALRAARTLASGTGEHVAWLDLAQRLGADVPACFASASSRMAGTGDRLTPCRLPAFATVLVNPMVAVPADKTRRVFAALGAGPVSRHDDDTRSRAPADLPALLETMRRDGNDLTAAACTVVPAISAVLARLSASDGCLHAQVSGAGPTCFGVFAAADRAQSAAARIASDRPTWWVRATTIGDA